MGTMTSDLSTNLITAAIALSALTIISLVALRGWRDWIQLKREELAAGRAPAQDQDPAVPHAGSRIEIADLKERLRKLEAIAEGVDLRSPRRPGCASPPPPQKGRRPEQPRVRTTCARTVGVWGTPGK